MPSHPLVQCPCDLTLSIISFTAISTQYKRLLIVSLFLLVVLHLLQKPGVVAVYPSHGVPLYCLQGPSGKYLGGCLCTGRNLINYLLKNFVSTA